MAHKSKKPKPAATEAIHAATVDGDIHAVAIWNLQVLLIPDHKFWIAQGLQIDYVAQGDSPEQAKSNFEKGLEESIDLNLRMYGNIKGLLVFAPDEVLQEAAKKKGSIRLYAQITTHDIGARYQQALPFDGISFLIAQEGTKEAA
jgi:hypothetical protein